MDDRPESSPHDSSAADPRPPDVTWRELQRGLWVGRSNGSPFGMIEQGRRFTFTDATDHVQRGFKSLEAAQGAATGSIPVVPPDASRAAEQPVELRVETATLRDLVSPMSVGLLALALGLLALVSELLLLV